MLVLDVPVKGEPMTVAIIANKVHDVTTLDAGLITSIPDIGMRWPPEFVNGVSKWHEEFVLMPDLEAIFSLMAARSTPAGSVEDTK
jgi:purine-binding chemotaxis protein CheW